MISLLKPKVPVSFSCRYFSVSRSHYYSWRKNKKLTSHRTKSEVKEKIKELFEGSKGTYGSPRIYRDLAKCDICVSENTVAKYMREMGLNARLKKKYRVMTTDSNHSDPIASRIFKTEDDDALPLKSGEILAGDITYLKLGEGHIYLAVVMDLFNREIIGWSISDTLKTSIIADALAMAMIKVGPDAEVVFHSDRGSQYASEAYRKLLKTHHAKPSMSRSGNCYDNAYVESWFASFKKEWLYRHDYSAEEELRQIVFEYIEVWYNKKRSHSSLDYKSPVEYKLSSQTA